jgi:hypothetical protein
VQNVQQSYESIEPLMRAAGVEAAVMFAPVEDVYDRRDPAFEDDAPWQECRRRANAYVLDLRRAGLPVFPFFFVWNDFRVDLLDDGYVGVKWHRHPDEPVYHYADPRCRDMLDAIVARGLPICLEETFENTLRMIEELAPDAAFIIPHLGRLNGGYERLEAARVWARPNVWTDTSASELPDLRSYVDLHGTDRLVYGSDYPFRIPSEQVKLVRQLGLSEEEERQVLAGNVLRLLGG